MVIVWLTPVPVAVPVAVEVPVPVGVPVEDDVPVPEAPPVSVYAAVPVYNPPPQPKETMKNDTTTHAEKAHMIRLIFICVSFLVLVISNTMPNALIAGRYITLLIIRR
jgi:hypothetical protein